MSTLKNVVAALAAACALAACGAPTAQTTAATTTTTDIVARGKYLVEGIGGCNDCHSPMTPQGPDMTKSLQGATLVFAPLIPIPWAPTAPAIAGLGAWDEAHFVSVLTTGKRPDGTVPLPPMPQFRLNEEDARAVAAYIATVPTAQ